MVFLSRLQVNHSNMVLKKIYLDLTSVTEVWNIATSEFFCGFVLMPGYSKALSNTLPTCHQ